MIGDNRGDTVAETFQTLAIERRGAVDWIT
jgi:hypothetical protein